MLRVLALAVAASAVNITYYHGHTASSILPYASLPAPHARSNTADIVRLLTDTGRSTVWKLVEAVALEGETFEPEGMVRLGPDRIVLSAGEYTAPTVPYGKDANGSAIIVNGTDRANGAGFAHLVVFAGNGSRIADATLSARGAPNYHNGGVDYDGAHLWCTLAEYRPNSTATLVRVDPRSLAPIPLFHIADHEGGVVHDTHAGTLTLLNWGARNASVFHVPWDAPQHPPLAAPITVVRNPSYFIDYQDCKWLGYVPTAFGERSAMLCAGVATVGSYNLGGLALVDVASMVPLMEVPLALTSALGVPITENPFDVDVIDGRLRLYFVPDQHNSTMYVYEAQPNSPYEY
jgi:hypothetical protein